jgi:lipopolysaccharide export system permease protein
MIIWRYLLGQYFKVLLLCTLAFVAILLTTRLDDIAHFTTLGAQGKYILLFTLYQIPYILPIAIPISGLISAILLIQRLSYTHELTAFRACGMGLRNILAPILLAAGLFSFLNFYIVSELATASHLQAGILKSELRSINPLLVLQNKHLMRLKGFYFASMGPCRPGESAAEVIVATPNNHNNRLNLLVAQQLNATSSSFSGKGVTLISCLQSDEGEAFDHLAIENMGQITTSVKDFSQMVQKKDSKLHNDHLRLPLLLARMENEHQSLLHAKEAKAAEPEIKLLQRNMNRCYSEIVRRISVAMAMFTFTLMGTAFGVSISRNRSSRGVVVVICLAAVYLIAYFVAKGSDHLLTTSILLYTLPHLLIIGLSIWALKRVTKGIE